MFVIISIKIVFEVNLLVDTPECIMSHSFLEFLALFCKHVSFTIIGLIQKGQDYPW